MFVDGTPQQPLAISPGMGCVHSAASSIAHLEFCFHSGQSLLAAQKLRLDTGEMGDIEGTHRKNAEKINQQHLTAAMPIVWGSAARTEVSENSHQLNLNCVFRKTTAGFKNQTRGEAWGAEFSGEFSGLFPFASVAC